MLPPSGDYLSGRVTLTNITKVSSTATLRFDNLECEDEKDYICTFNYVNEFGVIFIDESEPTRILVKAFPSMPDSISCVVTASIRIKKQDNSSANFPNNRNNIALSTNRNSRSSLLTDTVNLTPLLTTEKSVPSFRERDTVQFTCTGNIGKPPGRFVWEIILQQRETIVYSNETTMVVDQIPDICSYRGTSNLTVQITADHFKAKVRCFEESQADVLGMFVETEPLNISYPVRHIDITKQPNKAQYDQKTTTINLSCKGDGNPEPTYKWFRQEYTRSILSSTNLYIIEDVVKNNSDVYICVVYNTIDDIEYNANYSVEIYIVDELWSSKESDSLQISAEYAALVISVICVVVITMIWFGVRKHHCKRGKGKISSLKDASVIYAEVNEHTKLKYRLKNNQANSLNPEHADVKHDLMEDANEVSGDPRFKYNMITGKLEVYSNV
ncbi:CADM3 [Mytilus coruscus]|uniref:CADM3 n=1 Tax=Mytilus coruscus TaxID=42192 RepID=A0A6J8DVT6_MYTCO|nr:CADM3 [Mytilus coruscus]